MNRKQNKLVQWFGKPLIVTSSRTYPVTVRFKDDFRFGTTTDLSLSKVPLSEKNLVAIIGLHLYLQLEEIKNFDGWTHRHINGVYVYPFVNSILFH